MTISKGDKDSLEIAARFLAEGKVIVLPTDTVYGFSGIVPDCQEAIQKIKGRKEDKPFIRLISSSQEIFNYTNDTIPQKLLDYWPGPLTIIVPLKPELSEKNNYTAAFRCPKDNWLRQVIKKCGYPIYSTSVNMAGEPFLRDIHQIEEKFADLVELIVDGDDFMETEGIPSTIVDITGGVCRVVRQGGIVLPENFIALSK